MRPKPKERIIGREIIVAKLGSGWAAVEMVHVLVEGEGSYWDTNQTGIGRYANEAEAESEARDWCKAEGIEFNETR